MKNETTIFGIRAIIEAINSNEQIDKVFLQKGMRGELFQELEHVIRHSKVNTSYVPIEKLNRLSKGNHQGAVAQISPVAFYDIDELVTSVLESDKIPLFLLLDQLSDVRNFGAIVRTAECTGVSGIIIQKKGGAPINGDAIKTSAGAILKFQFVKSTILKMQFFTCNHLELKLLPLPKKLVIIFSTFN